MFIEDFVVTGTLKPDQINNVETAPTKLIEGREGRIVVVESFYARLDYAGKMYVLDYPGRGAPQYTISTIDRPDLCAFGDLDLSILSFQYNSFCYLKRKKPVPYGCFDDWYKNYAGKDLYFNLYNSPAKFINGNSELKYRMDCKAIDPKLIFDVPKQQI